MRIAGFQPLALSLLSLLALGVAPSRAADSDTIIMALPTFSMSFSLNYIAEDEGFYKANGLNIKSVEIEGNGSINAVIAGSAAFAQASSTSLTRAAAHGQPLLAIAEALNRPAAQVVLRDDVAAAAKFDPKASLKDRVLALRGHTIAVDAIGAVNHTYLRLIAKRAGFNPDDIHVAVMHPSSMVAALETKQIDGFAISLPWALAPVLDGKAVMVASGPDGEPADILPFANTVIVTRPETCAKRKPLCIGMGHAYVQAAAFIHEHPDEAQALLQKRFSTLDTKLVGAAFALIRNMTPNPPIVTKAALENTEIFNIDAGLMKPEEKLKSYDALFTDAYVTGDTPKAP